jgi:predicted transcriptional regulator
MPFATIISTPRLSPSICIEKSATTHQLLACDTAQYDVLSCIMSSPRTISFRIAPEKVAQLDSIAKAMDRDRSYLLNEAVETYLSEQQRFGAMVEEGLEDMRNGRYFEDEEVERMVGEWEQKGQ